MCCNIYFMCKLDQYYFVMKTFFIFSVSNAIVDQLLLDIDHVCYVSGEEDLSNLKKYILNERGWRCLTVLHLLGTQVRSN